MDFFSDLAIRYQILILASVIVLGLYACRLIVIRRQGGRISSDLRHHAGAIGCLYLIAFPVLSLIYLFYLIPMAQDIQRWNW